MHLEVFKTMWGFDGEFEKACIEAKEAGFDGIEGQAPKSLDEQKNYESLLKKYALVYIAEIVTGGDYVPARNLSVQDHIDDFKTALEYSLALKPLFVTCIGGCDAWSEDESILFFKECINLAKFYGVDVSFETHRSRSLFTPWITQKIVKAVPGIQLTLDQSHWCVVCERVMDSEVDVIMDIAPNIRHIHARVGYAQGPQVPHPMAPEYADELKSHQNIWEVVWDAQINAKKSTTTMTPEFGPDGYMHTLSFTQAAVADLWEINKAMNYLEREHYKKYIQKKGIK